MKSIVALLVPILSILLLIATVPAKAAVTSQETYASIYAEKKSPTGATFSFIRDRDTSTNFNLIITDGGESVVSASFTATQLEIIQTLLAEAKKFAMTDDGVGTNEPLTTRFFDKQERKIVIDVMKFKNESHFFVTVKSQIGQLTVEAGNFNRLKKTEEGFFSDMLLRVESALTRSRKLYAK